MPDAHPGAEPDATQDADTDVEDYPKCYGCGRAPGRAHLQPTTVHIDKEEGGYERVDVPMCRPCQMERFPTHECQTCGEEYLHLDRAAECCQHREERLVTDGGGCCSECGAPLPDEIEPDTGVYCPRCGTGQMVTDGGLTPRGTPCCLPNGFECCVFCWIPFGAEDKDRPVPHPGIGGGVNHTYGPVIAPETRFEYESVGQSDPGTPLAHVDCWREWAPNVRDAEQTDLGKLARFSEGAI